MALSPNCFTSWESNVSMQIIAATIGLKKIIPHDGSNQEIICFGRQWRRHTVSNRDDIYSLVFADTTGLNGIFRVRIDTDGDKQVSRFEY